VRLTGLVDVDVTAAAAETKSAVEGYAERRQARGRRAEWPAAHSVLGRALAPLRGQLVLGAVEGLEHLQHTQGTRLSEKSAQTLSLVRALCEALSNTLAGHGVARPYWHRKTEPSSCAPKPNTLLPLYAEQDDGGRQ